MPQAEVIAIGNELLLGRTQDTNTHWLAGQLSQVGLPLGRCQVIPDEPQALVDALNLALSRAEVVICTGGLGPTKDDLTKKTLADFFGLPLALHEATLQHVEGLYRSRGREPNAYVPLQATLPVGADILHNAVGTAPGMRFLAPGGKEVYALPGVPFEMQHLFETHLAPHIRQRFVTEHHRNHTLRTAAIPESELAGRIAHIEDNLPPEILLAYNPSLHAVDLRLNLKAPKAEQQVWDARFDAILSALRECLAGDIYGEQTTTLPEAIGQQLSSRYETVSVAESCTGGLLFHTLIQPAGASAWVRGGVVPYSNDLKTSEVGVRADTLAAHGAVSEAVARELAAGIRSRYGSTWGIGVTGIAGPTGGTDEKPVGTVWICIDGPTGSHARVFRFERHRLRNMQRTVVMALELLRRQMQRAGT